MGHLVDSEEDEDPFAFLVPNHEQVFMARHEGKARHEGNEPMAYGALDTCGLGGGAFVLQGGCVGERHLSTKVEGQGSGQGRPRGHGGWWVRGSKLDVSIGALALALRPWHVLLRAFIN